MRFEIFGYKFEGIKKRPEKPSPTLESNDIEQLREQIKALENKVVELTEVIKLKSKEAERGALAAPESAVNIFQQKFEKFKKRSQDVSTAFWYGTGMAGGAGAAALLGAGGPLILSMLGTAIATVSAVGWTIDYVRAQKYKAKAKMA